MALAVEPTLEKTDVGLKHSKFCHSGDPTMCAIEVEAGEKVPFTGVLQSHRQVAVEAVRADPVTLQQRVDEAVSSSKRESKADLDLEKKLHDIDNDAWQKKMDATEKIHQEQLKVAHGEFYTHPAFVVPVTIILTVGVIAGTAWIYHETRL